LARVAALSEAERVGYYVSKLDAFDGPISREEAERALRGLGLAAIPGLVPLLGVKNQAWRAAMLLADIGQPTTEVVAALAAALTRRTGADQLWVGRALSRLGRLDVVLDQIDRIPREAVVAAAAAPYTSFRNYATAPSPLDYRPLEDVLARWPAYATELAEELQPGRGYCEITRDEVDEAIHGLTSTHAIVRRHAVCVLGDRRLGIAIARRVMPSLARTISEDPDAPTRRLAILSLLWWRKDSRQYTDAVRVALHDRAVEVGEAAAYWLREQDIDQH
jgi:hypothetical protein